jgi:tetratricopeptide (TPR) repeat protein
MPQPICFMIMPYGSKSTQADPSIGVANIDFNALWDRAYAPVIKDLGYEPVRADQDTGAMIITQMIERLYFADLVLADMTIPNGNVYYEVGVRHAAKETGCVLLAAEWSKALFDVAQMRTLRYPLPEGAITDATAKAIQDKIRGPIASMGQGVSPIFESIPGYPTAVNPAAASSMKQVMAELATFQGEVRAVRALPHADRMEKAKALVQKYWNPPVTGATVLALIRLLKDSADDPSDWSWINDFIDKLPLDVADLEEVRETNAFALSNAGKPIEAIARLEELIARSGPTPERLGLLGGRYKRLFSKAARPLESLVSLNKAIDAYERGMELDLNQYYCSSNLPRLYRQRKRKEDEMRAQSVAPIVVAACERARKRNVADDWLNATLLGAAFDAHDCDKAEELATEVASQGAASWQIDSTLGDLKFSVSQVEDKDTKDRLQAILETLNPAVA